MAGLPGAFAFRDDCEDMGDRGIFLGSCKFQGSCKVLGLCLN